MFTNNLACAEPEWGQGSGPLALKNLKNIGFLSNTGPAPLKITKLSSYSPTGIIRNAKIWNNILFLPSFKKSTTNMDLKYPAVLE